VCFMRHSPRSIPILVGDRGASHGFPGHVLGLRHHSHCFAQISETDRRSADWAAVLTGLSPLTQTVRPFSIGTWSISLHGRHGCRLSRCLLLTSSQPYSLRQQPHFHNTGVAAPPTFSSYSLIPMPISAGPHCPLVRPDVLCGRVCYRCWFTQYPLPQPFMPSPSSRSPSPRERRSRCSRDGREGS